tara:strand:+ start:10927 stop:13746 length:2820 start_codon:yes stop_codon:yes gene_type:complete
MELDNRPAWLSRAMNKNTPSKNGATVQTANEYVKDLGGEVIYPTLRMGKDGKLRDADIDEALDKKDYILVKGPLGKKTADKAVAKSKQISKQIGIARQMKQGGTMAKTKKARAGLGMLPMTNKQSNPVGNKRQTAQKMPQKGASPKVIDPRDEAIKLVSKKYEQDKKQGLVVPPPMATAPVQTAPMQTALVPMQPMQPMEEETPTPMKKGGTKTKEGMSVVIGLGSGTPSYEQASMGDTQDPPPGATSEEVADDQQVLLSKGELVVPANVVRYHGLGTYEGMRREALMGLKQMEDAGQVEYVDDEPKKAQAGLALASGPSVATTPGIQQQQQTYNPALGQFGTATTPQAASAKFIRTPGFIDRNKDGIEDRLQPSVTGTTGVVPAAFRSPAALATGPVTNPNIVVGAGNVGAYKDVQSDATRPPGEETTTPPPQNNQGMARRTAPVTSSDISGSDDNNEMAELGGARVDIGGQEYAIQYDFKGNVTGLASVSDYRKTGNINFIEPSDDIKNSIAKINQGQRALARGIASPVMNAMGLFKDDAEIIATGKNEVAKLRGSSFESKTQEAVKQDAAAAADIAEEEKGIVGEAPTVKAPSLNTQVSNLLDKEKEIQVGREPIKVEDLKSQNIPDFRYAPGDITGKIGDAKLTKAEMDFLTGKTNTIKETDPTVKSTLERLEEVYRNRRESPEDIIVPTVEQEPRNRYGQTKEEERKGVEIGLSRGFNPETVAPGTATNAALTGKGYSPSGAAPRGSQFSATGVFSSGSDDDDDGGVGTSGDLGGATGAGRTGEGTEGVEGVGGTQTAEETTVDPTKGKDLSRTFADDAATSDTGGGKIVCTEMYRQTQLDDWAQAMKIWYVYQKKYLTSTHQVGYHWLFKPFVSGMRVNNVLTKIGAYFAKERTKHLRHILTKGRAKDSIVGNIFCKIIHPIVYLAGCAIRKK